MKAAADAAGRKICFMGTSLHSYLEAAERVGRAPIDPRHILTPAQAGEMDDNEVLIVTTGSQVGHNRMAPEDASWGPYIFALCDLCPARAWATHAWAGHPSTPGTFSHLHRLARWTTTRSSSSPPALRWVTASTCRTASIGSVLC